MAALETLAGLAPTALAAHPDAIFELFDEADERFAWLETDEWDVCLAALATLRKLETTTFAAYLDVIVVKQTEDAWLVSSDQDRVRAAVETLDLLAPAKLSLSANSLAELLDNELIDTRRAALEALIKLEPDRANERIPGRYAIGIFGSLIVDKRDPVIERAFLRLIDDEDEGVRLLAADLLNMIESEALAAQTDAIVSLMDGYSTGELECVAQAIGELDPATIDGLGGVLLHCLADDDEVVRLAALKPFGKLDPRMLVAHASPLVERLLDDEEDYGVRQAAAEILSVLEPITLVEFADGLEHANGSAVLRILELARAGKDLDESESESESESE